MPVNIRIAVGDEWGDRPVAYRELVIERKTNRFEDTKETDTHDLVSQYEVKLLVGRSHQDVLDTRPRPPRVVATIDHRYGDDALTLLKEALDAVHEQALLDGIKHV